MKVEVGYITSWRRAIFITVIIAITVFGLVSTVSTAYLGAGLVSNIISVGALVLCIGLFILVLADKWNHYSGYGTAAIEDGIFTYNDKKHHYEIKISDIKKIDMEKITTGREGGKPLAYRMLIKTERKKYYIESERAAGCEYNEVDLYRLYLYLNQNM